MIVEIDGYFDRTLLHSEKDLSERELRKIYDQIKNEGISWRELPNTLCNRYNMKKVGILEGIRIDIVIDTDTDRIYKPHY
ncbi:hypothetical protein AMS62_19910 [Bacillus sp. FJAT-18019]|nr:hypothetical protein AMS62_19910 [Bacillus sp. FJAT-18019]